MTLRLRGVWRPQMKVAAGLGGEHRQESRALHVLSTTWTASWVAEGVLRRPGPEVCVAPGAERARSSLVVPGIVHLGLQSLPEVFRSFPRTAMRRSKWTWPLVLFQTPNAKPQVLCAPWACGKGAGLGAHPEDHRLPPPPF